MERRVWVEDVDQELAREVGVDQNTAVRIVLQTGFTFDDDERPVPQARKLGGGANDFVDRAIEIGFVASGKRGPRARNRCVRAVRVRGGAPVEK